MDFTDGLLRSAWALAIVLSLMMAVAAAARRLFRGRVLLPDQQPVVRILGGGYLGARKSIAVIAVAEEIFVVGSTADSLVPLGRITDREQVRRLLSQSPAVGIGERVVPGQPDLMSPMTSLGARIRALFHKADQSPTKGVGEHGTG